MTKTKTSPQSGHTPGPLYRATIQAIGESALVVVSDSGNTWGLPLEMFKQAAEVNKQRNALLEQAWKWAPILRLAITRAKGGKP